MAGNEKALYYNFTVVITTVKSFILQVLSEAQKANLLVKKLPPHQGILTEGSARISIIDLLVTSRYKILFIFKICNFFGAMVFGHVHVGRVFFGRLLR